MADLKLSDLRVAKAESGWLNLRFATPADILEVAATLPGAEKVWWCVGAQEDGPLYGVTCPPGDPHLGHDCGWRLVIPLEDS